MEEKNSKGIVSSIIILILVAGVVAIYFIYFKNDKKVEDTTTTLPTVPTTKAIVKNYDYINEDGYQVFKIEDMYQGYFPTEFYLKDGNLYFNKIEKFEYTPNVEEGKPGELLASNVYAFYHVDYGNGGLQRFIYVDNEGIPYFITNDTQDLDGKPLNIEKIEGVKDIKDIYSLAIEGAAEFILVNTDNQIVSYNKYWVYYDKKNNIRVTKIGDDIVELLPQEKQEAVDDNGNTVDRVVFDILVNGKSVPSYTYDIVQGLSRYDEIDLIGLPACYINNELVIDGKCFSINFDL